VSPLHVFVELVLVLKFPSTFIDFAFECHLWHIVNQCINKLSETLNLLEFFIICNILYTLITQRFLYHNRV
jgi:hypothetical protein